MSNAFDAIYDVEDTSSSLSTIESFKKETSKKAEEKARITYEEIFNITKSLEPVNAKFKSLDEADKVEFREKSSAISEKYSKKIDEVSEDLALSDGEKKYEIHHIMNDMVKELTIEATQVFTKSLIDDTAEAAEGTYSDIKGLSEGKIPFVNEEVVDNATENLTGAKERTSEMMNNMAQNYTLSHTRDEIEQSTNNLVTELSHIAVTEAFGSIVNSDVTAYLVNPTLLARDITESFNDSAVDLSYSVKENILDAPLDFVDSMADVGKGIAQTIVDYPLNLAKNKIESIGGTIQSYKDEAVHYVAEKAMNFRNTAVNTAERALTGDLLPPKVTGTESLFDNVTVSPISRDQYRVISATSRDLKVGSVVTESIYMSLDNYWDIDINVPIENTILGQPSFRDAYGLEELLPYYHLPISSFNFSGEGVINTEEVVYPGMVVPLPSIFQKPSKLNIQLPELVHRTTGQVVPCMLKFKQDYVNYVMNTIDTANSLGKTNYTFRNFRECVYKITIRKFSPRWELLKSWGFYGVPEIMIQESGSSSPTVEYSDLTFSIVGEFEPKILVGMTMSSLEKQALGKLGGVTSGLTSA